MKTSKDMLWTWLLPDEQRGFDRAEWVRRGGKWIVFDDRKAVDALAAKLVPFIDSGEIAAACSSRVTTQFAQSPGSLGNFSAQGFLRQ